MLRFLVAVALIWLILLPPFFTDGACTGEFDAESAKLHRDQRSLQTSTQAVAYWNARGVPVSVVSAEQCQQAKPRYADRCGSGPLVYSEVPVKNRICRYYRDDVIRIQLQYGKSGQLERMQTDMNPYKSLPVPFTNNMLHWGR